MQRYSHLLSLALAAALSFAAGCGEEEGIKRSGRRGGDTKAGTGGKKAKEILVGTWKLEITIDDDKATDALRKYAAANKKTLNDEQIKAALNQMKQGVATLSFVVTFNADGTSSGRKAHGPNAKEEVNEGKWEIVSEDGPKVTLKVTDTTGPDKDKPDEFKLTIEDDKTLRIDEGPKMKEIPGTMRFKKQ